MAVLILKFYLHLTIDYFQVKMHMQKVIFPGSDHIEQKMTLKRMLRFNKNLILIELALLSTVMIFIVSVAWTVRFNVLFRWAKYLKFFTEGPKKIVFLSGKKISHTWSIGNLLSLQWHLRKCFPSWIQRFGLMFRIGGHP